ncbi:MAG TPA: type II and III secretion system protein family protein [Salinarimonas sp.]|nr:type II and III secretion system protein family protein [Salinarimonas sp.]
MTMSLPRRPGVRPALVAAVLAALGPAPALAKNPGAPPPPLETGAGGASAPVIAISPAEQGGSRRLDLSIGRSVIIDLPRDAKEVFVANPKVANAVVRSTRKIFVIGMENGATSIFVLDAEGRQIATLEINVGRDLNVLRQTLRTSLPTGQIEVRPAGDSILLTGSVASAAEAQQAIDIANAFVGVSGGLFSSSRGGVMNALTIRGKDQVMLRVTVVEVARSVLKQFGITTSGGWSGLNLTTAQSFSLNPQVQAASNSLTGGFSAGGFSLNATLNAFERAGVSRVLAEPTLVAISGEAATFTAGGEIPIPSGQSCEVVPGSSSPRCTTGISFKPFGISLSFTPVVLSENRISLRVNTEVTELDYENQFRYDTVNVPGMKVRKSTTSVELPSGASMMTAGLLSQTWGQAISGTPALMNLPILGALFRSRDYQRRETELMILVTPYIAKAMEAREVARPDDGFVESYDGQAVLLGRLNKLYGMVGADNSARGYRGRFGFITD